MKIAIDFDDVLHNPKVVKPGYKMGTPIPGAKEALTLLKKQGHEIIIFPVWADTQERRKAITDWLKYFEIPFDDITSVKPDADIFLDDKAVRFTLWAEVLDFVSKLST